MKVAYADPPYIGQAKKHYGSNEVDHDDLIRNVLAQYDAWALSCSSPTLKQILMLCPDGVRIGAWCKPFCAFKVNVNPAYAWEPVIYYGGRKRGRQLPTLRDWIAEPIALKRGVVGAKPVSFCYWLFEMLGMEADDEFHDLFPGTGIVGRCWELWKNQGRLLK